MVTPRSLLLGPTCTGRTPATSPMLPVRKRFSAILLSTTRRTCFVGNLRRLTPSTAALPRGLVQPVGGQNGRSSASDPVGGLDAPPGALVVPSEVVLGSVRSEHCQPTPSVPRPSRV